ncbi:SDR family oxidoreductase [Nocardia grenadensis]|uniref:SDR family oxidoreductase n=1 Tax=Nocardia grenadensis TaxID=931537 RepID=UPI000A005D74|nr:SDR family oxidoreductase [Nocardia grenadensis]
MRQRLLGSALYDRTTAGNWYAPAIVSEHGRPVWTCELRSQRLEPDAVQPGVIATALTEMPIDGRQFLENEHPLERFGRADEVAAVAAFLLSAETSFITRARYLVDGSYTAL